LASRSAGDIFDGVAAVGESPALRHHGPVDVGSAGLAHRHLPPVAVALDDAATDRLPPRIRRESCVARQFSAGLLPSFAVAAGLAEFRRVDAMQADFAVAEREAESPSMA
jgi:hypothetical protein